MKQILFQAFWNMIKKSVTSHTTMIDFAKNPDTAAEQIAKDILVQIEKSEMFGGPNLIFAGDSNCEFGNHFKEMSFGWKNCGVVINIGKAGSRFDTWVKILNSNSGKKVLQYIKDHKTPIFLNLGGNHLLQKSMENLESSIKEFISLFGSDQKFAVADMPDIMIPTLIATSQFTEKYLKDGLITINKALKTNFKVFVPLGEYYMVIDEMFGNYAGEQLEQQQGVFFDALIHYSQLYNEKVRYPYYSKIAQEMLLK